MLKFYVPTNFGSIKGFYKLDTYFLVVFYTKLREN